jgi:hypothetical protein
VHKIIEMIALTAAFVGVLIQAPTDSVILCWVVAILMRLTHLEQRWNRLEK